MCETAKLLSVITMTAHGVLPQRFFFFLNINTYNLAVGFESEYFKNEYEQLLFKSKSYSGDNILKKISGNVFTLIEFCY